MKNTYVLYDSTDDSVVCNNNFTTMLFDSRKSALKEWIGYPEEIKHFSRLPIHIKEMIIEEQNALSA